MEILLFIFKGLALIPIFMLIIILICAYNDGNTEIYKKKRKPIDKKRKK